MSESEEQAPAPNVEGREIGESVANYWARLLVDCQDAPVEIADRRGEVVAVIVSKDWWDFHHKDWSTDGDG